jgi:hypothetical protein
MPGSHVQAHELKGRGAWLNALPPTDDADHRVAGLGKGDPASARHQPVTPADLTVPEADTVEIFPRNQVAVGLLPTLRLERSDGSNIGRRSRTESDNRAALRESVAGRHTDIFAAHLASR